MKCKLVLTFMGHYEYWKSLHLHMGGGERMQLESVYVNISGLLSKEISEKKKKKVQVSKTPSWVYKKNFGLEYWQVIEGKNKTKKLLWTFDYR